MKYDFVRKADIEIFINTINAYLDDGFKLHGKTKVIVIRNVTYYTQAVVKMTPPAGAE